MKNSASNEVKRGQAISFRIPSDTPDHLLKQLQKLKETERRNFSSKIAEFVIQGVGTSFSRERETVTIPLPHKLTKAQRDWLKFEHSEALLGSIIYQLISDPVRSTALLASLNSKSTDIDEALYLQEETIPEVEPAVEPVVQQQDGQGEIHSSHEETASSADADEMDDDLSSFDWRNALPSQDSAQDAHKEDAKDEGPDDLLGDFLASMNK